MTWQPRWLAVLLLGLTVAGCSLLPESGSNRPGSYVVFGQRYDVLQSTDGFIQRGIASWYGRKFHGKRTSSGEIYDMYAMTAAHKRLPIPCQVEVINLTNGRRAVVRVNDRGPFVRNRVIDLSYAAAKQLGMLSEGTAPVEIRPISQDPMITDSPSASTTPAMATPAMSATRAHRNEVFYVQVGAFTDRTNAYRLQGRLEAAELTTSVRVEPIDDGGNKYYRVRLGPLRSRDAAGQLARQLTDYGVSDAHTIDLQ